MSWKPKPTTLKGGTQAAKHLLIKVAKGGTSDKDEGGGVMVESVSGGLF